MDKLKELVKDGNAQETVERVKTLLAEGRTSEDILKQANACKKKFSCLSGDPKNLCEIEACMPDTIYVLKGENIETWSN